MSHHQGFTLIELVVSIAIIVLLLAVIATPFRTFRNSKILDTSAEETLALLSEARGNTLSAKDGYQYGVHFESTQIVMYRGATYVSNDTNNKVVALDSAIEVSSVALAGGASDVLFSRLTGNTSQTGTVTLRIKTDTAKTRTITIGGTGVASGS